MNASGPFEVTMTGEPPYALEDGISLGRAKFEKRFSGSLNATSTVHMLAARTAIPNSAGYVALERIAGILDGKTGSFVVVHMGLMNRGTDSLVIHIVPDSGTGELVGIAGTMTIQRDNGHHYGLDYTL
jgi:Protein of unknown function (DUF3224)